MSACRPNSGAIADIVGGLRRATCCPNKRSVLPDGRYPPKDVVGDRHMADGRERQVSGHQRLAGRRQFPQKTHPNAGRLLGVVFEAVVPLGGGRTRPRTRRRRRTSAGRRRSPGGPCCARGCGRRCAGRRPPAPPRTPARIGQRHLVGLIEREITRQVHVTGEGRRVMDQVRRGDLHPDNVVDLLPIRLAAVGEPTRFRDVWRTHERDYKCSFRV